MPVRTRAAPKIDIGAGNFANIKMPSNVAPTGSSKAMVAVSNDLRFEREEKYKECAMAVGKIPKPISAKTRLKSKGKLNDADTAEPAISTVTAEKT